ncbi:MAG: SDR family oxidoreductase [Ignavibacteriae bacterium]|nr:SDR family oxidoreductase [Ignavibacteriota bacterium]
MKVLFIGGTGNISTEVSKLCLEKRIDLYLLNRGNSENKIHGAKEIICDYSNFEQSENLLKNHSWDAVVNWIAFNKNDVEKDIKLFSGKTNQYIFISSASAYQKPPASPVITESTPLKNPFWQYSRDKIECEETLMKAYRNNDFPVTIVRPSHTYDTVIPISVGPWNEYTVVDRIKKRKKIIVHGDGTSLWVVTHSKDFAKGFIGLLGHQQAIGESFHITSDELLTWNQIYEAIAEAVNNEPNIIHIPSDFIGKYDEQLKCSLLGDKSYSVIFDNTKIKKFVPDFKATIPFKIGIKETINWFEAKQERRIIKQESNNLIDKIITDYEEIFLR